MKTAITTLLIVFFGLLYWLTHMKTEEKKMKTETQEVTLKEVAEPMPKLKKPLVSKTKTSAKAKISKTKGDILFPEVKKMTDKALPTAEERELIQNALKNQEKHREVFLLLSDLRFENIDRDEGLRIQGINFIEKALQLDDQPMRAQILMNIKSFLFDKRFYELEGERERKTVLGDKMDLYRIAYQNAPEELERWKDQNPSFKRADWVRYVNNRLNIKTSGRNK